MSQEPEQYCHDQDLVTIFLQRVDETLELIARINEGIEALSKISGRSDQLPKGIIDNQDLSEMVSINNAYLQYSVKLLENNERLQREVISHKEHHERYKEYHERLMKENFELKKSETALRDSRAFRLGKAIIRAFKKPGMNTVLLPYSVFKIILNKT